jgi:hypothetical protein
LITSYQTAKAIAQGRATIHHHTGTPLKPGSEYPVQPGRGRPALCRIHVNTVSTQPIGAITFHDARHAGYRTTQAFKAAWVRHHDKPWVGKQRTDPEDQALAERFDTRHTGTIVQAVTFSVVQDEPRYLASQYDILHGNTDRGEFTTRMGRAVDELEVVDETTMERYAKAAEAHGVEQRQGFLNQQHAQQQRKRNSRLDMFRGAA